MRATGERGAEAVAESATSSGWAVPGVGPATGSLSAAATAAVGDPATGAGPGGPGGSSHPIVVALVTCLEALESVRGVGAYTLSAHEIRLMLLAVMQVMAAVFGLKLRLIVAGEVQRVADLTGATSVAAFLAHLTQTRRADASAEVRLARDLDRRFPRLAEALEQGLMSPEQVKVAVSALRRLPRDLEPAQWDAVQRVLVEAAQGMNPSQLRTVGRKLWEVIDPDGAEAKEGKDLQDEEDLARARAYFRSWRNGDGTTGFRGKLPDLQADMLIKAIQAFASPRRRANPNIPTSQPDDMHRDSDTTPELAGHGAAPDSDGGHRDAGESHEEETEGESPEERETGRSIPYPVKLGHGLMDLVERIPPDLLPSSGGLCATVVVTMRLEQLHDALGVATVDTGTMISATQARRLACEAGIIPIVLGGQSQPLDIGRQSRLHNKYQRIALGVRDGGCITEGCDRPAAFTEVHHPRPWKDGGTTSLENGVLVCPYHHHLWHHPAWEVTQLPQGKVRFRRRTDATSHRRAAGCGQHPTSAGSQESSEHERRGHEPSLHLVQ